MSRAAVSAILGTALCAGAAGVVAAGAPQGTAAGKLPAEMQQNKAKLEVVHEFRSQMPVGVTVSSTGRRFVSYPRWGDPVKFTLAELKNGREVPWPRGGAYQNGDKGDPRNNLVSLQGLSIDAQDRLWVLDTGTVKMQPIQPFVPKLVCYNTRTGAEELKFRFPADVVPPGSYLNDLRIDLTRGAKGTIYITDSGKQPGIVVFDIAGQKAVRRLANHPSVQPEKAFVGFVEGRALFKRPTATQAKHVDIGSDGIAISPDGKTLYYCPLASRRLYSVSCDALADSAKSDEEVAATVKDLGDKGAADGMCEDQTGRIYVTNWEQNAVVRRLGNGLFETVVHDDRMLWPDTLSLGRDGYLYVISNQLHRQKDYNAGKDLRQRPYLLTRIRIGAQPVALGPNATRGGQTASR